MPGRAQVEPRQHVAPQRAHAAVGVADAGAEEDVEDAGQDRVADVAVQPRHRARVDVVHPVAHHELGAVVELLDEARDLVEVVGQVGVGHDDVVAARGGEAGEVGAAVAAPRLVHDARAGRRGELGASGPRSRCRRRRPRRGCPASRIALERARDAALDVLLLVEAGDDDRDDELARPGTSRRAAAGLSAASVLMAVATERRDEHRGERDRTREGCAPCRVLAVSLCAPHADLPRLRLPVPVHGRRRRALVPQPRAAARGRRPRGHLPDAAPVGRAASAASFRACASSRPARGWRSTRGAGSAAIAAAARVRRRRALRTCCATAGATTSSTPRRSRTSRCWPPARRAAAARATASSSTGTRCGARRTGASTSAASAAASAGRSSALCLRVPPARVLLRAS